MRFLVVITIFAAASSMVGFAADGQKAPRRIEVTKAESEVISHGDKLNLVLKLRAKTLIQETLLVDEKDSVYLPDLGRLSLLGMSPTKAASMITQKYQERLYPTSIAIVSYQRTFKNLAINEKK